MKKNLALILALVMLIGSLFSIVPMAEATDETPPSTEGTVTEKYVPEIEYSNFNYSDKMYMKFAVPAPTNLGETASVKLLLWESIDDVSFSYKDTSRLALEPAAETVSINGSDYLVFTYDAITAAEMDRVIYARPVVVENDKATAYGSVIEYSILEYVATAKGEFEGIAGIDNPEFIELLNTLLDFGALAQVYGLEEEPAFYVNEELSKVFITPVLNGDVKVKTFAGFYKYEEGGYTTLVAPHYDGYQVVSFTDKDGVVLTDASDDAGFQIVASESDVEIFANYSNIAITTLVSENYSSDFNFNTVDGYIGSNPSEFASGSGTSNGFNKALYTGSMKLNNVKQIDWNNSAASSVYGSEKSDGSSKSYRRYHGFKTVADPESEGQTVFQWTASDYGGFTHSQFSEKNLRAAGVDDTLGTVITFTMDLGGHNGKVGNFGTLYHRLRVSEYYDNNADGTPQLDENGEPKISTTRIDIDTPICRVNGGKFQIVSSAGGYIDIGEVPVDSMRKFAVVVDYDVEMVYGYAEDENSVMQLIDSASIYCAKYDANAGKLGFDGKKSLILPSTAEGVIKFSNGWTFTGASNWGTGDSAVVDLDGDGEATDKVMDGYVANPTSCWALVNDKLTAFSSSKHSADQRMSPNYNLKAVQMYAEENCAILIDNYYLLIGNPYN